MTRAGSKVAFAWLLVLLAGGSAAGAPDIASRLAAYEHEARTIVTNIPQPNEMSNAANQRRLVEAQVAFSIGNYDTSSLVLFDLVGRTQGQDRELATFYLAE